MPVRLLIVDDHEVVRMGVRALFAIKDSIEVCGEAQNGMEAIRKVLELSPDLVILDVSMPGMNGFETAEKIRLIAPCVKIVLFSVHEIPATARFVGVDGFVSKSSSTEELLLTVNRLLQSGRNLQSECEIYTGRVRDNDFAVPSETRERRRQQRINLSQVVRIRPFDTSFPPEFCTTFNVSRDALYLVTLAGHYSIGANVYVTSDFQVGSQLNYDTTGVVVRVDKLEDDKWGVAIYVFPPSSLPVQ
jgi:DNA-binding NarL/FixJ family response regulator